MRFENGYLKCLYLYIFVYEIMDFIHSFIHSGTCILFRLCFCNGNIVYGKVQLNPCFVYIALMDGICCTDGVLYMNICEREYSECYTLC